LRALFVVSTWKPHLLADVQRVRMLIPAMREAGWEVEVLYPDQSYQAAYSFDSESPRFYPDVPEHPVGPWMEEIFKVVGSRSIGIRAGVPLARKGLELLKSRKFDVVYFSTTQHLLTCAGPWWRRKTGVPYVADVHDPVFIPQPKYRTSESGLKARLAREVGRWIERRALAQADGVVSVSRGYVDDLLARNPEARWAVSEMGDGRSEIGTPGVAGGGSLVAGNFPSSISDLPYPTSTHVLVQPFPADERGLEMVKAERRETGKKRIVYVGAGGNIMERGWKEFLGQLKKEPLAKEVVIEIYGTDPFWKTGDRVYLQKISEEMGLRGLVVEEPTRVSYERSLALVKGADGLLVLGVDDPNYQPSKLHTYLATGLPAMVLCHQQSDVRRQMESVEGVKVLRFEGGKVIDSGKEQVESGMNEYLQSVKEGKRWPQRKRLTAGEAAFSHAQLFSAVAGLS
jgi:glycosyltransferase involved in cell wall biosynthesis